MTKRKNLVAVLPPYTSVERQFLNDIYTLFYKTHYQRLYRFCRRLVGDPGIVEDIVQESFTRVFAVFLECRGAIGSRNGRSTGDSR